jgi:hypothetical protein
MGSCSAAKGIQQNPSKELQKHVRVQSTATSGIENKDGTRGGEVLF